MFAISPVGSKLGTDNRCGICDATFSKPEHLARYAKSHTCGKPFMCLVCGKSFSRQDVLSRHRTSHEQHGDKARAVTRSRACRQCAASRSAAPVGTRAGGAVNVACLALFLQRGNGKTPSVASPRPLDMNLEAIRTTVGEQAVGETVMLTTKPAVLLDVSSSGLNECDLEETNGNYLVSGTANSWTQRQAVFEALQSVRSVDSDPQRVYGFSAMPSFSEQVMDLLSMNWIYLANATSIEWNGHTEAPRYTDDDKRDLYMPSFFPVSGPSLHLGGNCVLCNGQRGIGEHNNNIMNADYMYLSRME